MTIQKVVQTQRSFSGGEVSPTAHRRDDTEIMRAGLRRCRNMRPLATGPVTRRDGFAVRWSGAGRIARVNPTPNIGFWVEFSAATLTIRPVTNPSVVHTTITSCPWAADDIAGLTWDAAGTTFVVTHRDGIMVPQVFSYLIANDAWVRQDFSFALSFTNEKRQPYHRFQDTLGVTMTPSARTGSSITLTFSEPILQAAIETADFPTITASSGALGTAASPGFAFPIPAGGPSGEGEEEEGEAAPLLLAILSLRAVSGAAPVITVPDGWNVLANLSNADVRLMAIWRVEDGSEDSSVPYLVSANAFHTAFIYRISGHAEELYAIASSGDEYPDPAALSVPGLETATLWMAAGAIKNAQIVAPAVGYSAQSSGGSTNNEIYAATATRNLAAKNDNPGDFDTNALNTNVAMTIAIKGTSAATQGHVGVRFLYVDKEVEVTAVNSPTSATASVIDVLPPSQALTSESADDLNFAAFSIGDLVEGEESGARGEVIAKASSTSITVQLYSQQNGFVDEERVIGPKSTATLTGSGAGSFGNPGAIVNWKEELVNGLRGWPGAVTLDRQRLIFVRIQQFPQAVLWSAPRTIDDFAVTAEADSGLFEYVPGDVSVEAVTGGPDEFVFTNNGIYYVPISSASPLSPGSVEFRLVSAEAVASIKPVWMPDGLVFVSASRTRIYSLVPTGQTTQPYIVKDISQYHDHLFAAIRDVAVVSSGAIFPGQTLVACMDDGTLAVAQHDAAQDWVGWFPWITPGLADSLAALGERLLVRFSYTIAPVVGEGEEEGEAEAEEGEEEGEPAGPTTVWTAEELSAGTVLDTAIPKDDNTLLANFAGQTLALWGNGRYLGTATVNSNGTLATEDVLPADTYAGSVFTPEVTPFTPNVGEGESIHQRMRKRRISKAAVTVYETTGFNIDRRVVPNYVAGEDQDEAPPRRSKTYPHRRIAPRSYDPQLEITQPIPGDLTIVEISMEVGV